MPEGRNADDETTCSPDPPSEQATQGINSRYATRTTGRFWKVFAICLVVSAPTCGCLGFANALAAMGRAFGPNASHGSTEEIYDLTQFPLAGNHPGTVIINCIFWAACLSLIVASIWTMVARVMEHD